MTHFAVDLTDLFGGPFFMEKQMIKYVLGIFAIIGCLSFAAAPALSDPAITKTGINGYGYDELVCLAQNIYFEARNQSRLGQIGVSLVVLERVRQDFYPNDICSVVKQGSLSTGEIYSYFKDPETGEVKRYPSCQFSWYCDGLPDDMVVEVARINAMRVAWYVLHTPEIWDLLDRADHYHATSVSPSWAGTAIRHRITQIDDHIFWRR